MNETNKYLKLKICEKKRRKRQIYRVLNPQPQDREKSENRTKLIIKHHLTNEEEENKTKTKTKTK